MTMKCVSLFRALNVINAHSNCASFRSLHSHFKGPNAPIVKNYISERVSFVSVSQTQLDLQLTSSGIPVRCMHNRSTKSDENLQIKNQSVVNVCRLWTDILEKHNIPEARVSVEYILAHVLGKKTMHGISGWQELNSQQMERVTAMCQQRLQHTPVQYILGEWDFHDIELKMKPPVFIPRPETEELVEAAGMVLETKEMTGGQFLELCCGSGAISLALLHKFPLLRAVAVDVSSEACSLTEENAHGLGLSHRLTVLTADITDAAAQDRLEDLGPFDLLVSNPPYIPSDQVTCLEPHILQYEDLRALDGGEDGLDIIKHILHLAPHLLKAECDILLEIQPGQPELIHDVVKSTELLHRLQYLSSQQDYCDRERFCHLRTVDSQQSR